MNADAKYFYLFNGAMEEYNNLSKKEWKISSPFYAYLQSNEKLNNAVLM
jgi:hypothetical protein